MARQRAALAAISLGCIAASAASVDAGIPLPGALLSKHELSGPIDPAGTAEVTIATREKSGGAKIRVYRFKFRAVPVDCEGVAATASRLKTGRVTKFQQLNRIFLLRSTVVHGDGTRSVFDLRARRLRARKAVGHVRVHGSGVDLQGGGRSDCDSGDLRWKATA
jgi:hypothetical protein